MNQIAKTFFFFLIMPRIPLKLSSSEFMVCGYWFVFDFLVVGLFEFVFFLGGWGWGLMFKSMHNFCLSTYLRTSLSTTACLNICQAALKTDT